MGIPFWDGKIALVQTERGWEIPGGHIEDGEDLSTCLKRELFEEVGATSITSERLFGFRKITNPDRKMNTTTGRMYPRTTVVPYYLVDLGVKPTGGSAIDSIASGLFDIYDPVVEKSHDRDLILIAYSLHQYIDMRQ
jgi:ADP-ribose pyrophosphatase YjhB (NUDIX family)